LSCWAAATLPQIQTNAFSLSQLLRLLHSLLLPRSLPESTLTKLGLIPILQRLTTDDRVIVKDIAAEVLHMTVSS
jgi:hypothetical protein